MTENISSQTGVSKTERIEPINMNIQRINEDENLENPAVQVTNFKIVNADSGLYERSKK